MIVFNSILKKFSKHFIIILMLKLVLFATATTNTFIANEIFYYLKIKLNIYLILSNIYYLAKKPY